MASSSNNCCTNLIKSKSKNSLSGTILEYYTKYGQNRDLEKYFRFRRGQSSSGSSIGSNHNTHECPVAAGAANRLGRSLDNLSNSPKPSTSSANSKSLPIDNVSNEKVKSRSAESIDRSATKSADEAIKKTVSVEQITKTSRKNKNKKKSINFTMESNIVLNVSQPPGESRSPSGADKKDNNSQTDDRNVAQQNQVMESSIVLNESNSNCASLSPIVDKKDSESQTDIPNVADESMDNHPNSANSSPVSVSNKHRLEWDSLADVGYANNKTHDKHTETTPLSTLDRKSLNNFKMTEIQANKTSTSNISPDKKSKNNWKMALKKFREKYKSSYIEQSLLENESQVCFSDPKIHSTPNVQQPKNETEIEDTVKSLVAMLEKSCQTSIIGMESKEIQVDKSLSTDRATSVQSTVDTTNTNKSISRASEKNQLSEDDSSFEFITPKTYEKGQQKDNNDANKENIQPVATAATSLTIQSNMCNGNKQSTLPPKVKEAIGHLNALLESKEIDNKTKKQQIHKIVLALFNVMHPNQSKSSSSSSSNNRKSSKNSSDQKSISGIDVLSTNTTPSYHSNATSKCAQPISNNNLEMSTTTAIKNLLQPVTHSEIDFQHHLQIDQQNHKIDEANQRKIIEKLVNAQRKRSDDEQTQINLIEKEINRLAALKARLIKENVSTANINENFLQRQLSDKSQDNKTISTAGQSSRDSDKKLIGWQSHEKLHQTASSRMKLQTPLAASANNNISEYAQEKLQQFINKYETKSTKLYEKQPEIYTQPYSSSSGGNNNYSDNSQKRPSSKLMKNDAYTSMSDGSDRFLSMNSVSIPGANSLLSHTSTHQYDTRNSVAIQTGDSLRRTEPIIVEKPTTDRNRRCRCASADPDKYQCKCHCMTTLSSRQRTIRVSQVQNNKQQQTMPESIAYVLTFDKQMSSVKPNTGKSTMSSFPSSRSSCGSSVALQSAVDSKVTLQQHLEHRRPDFLINAEDRRKCLQEIHNLRLKQCEQRNKLLLLTSSNTLRKYLSNAAPFAVPKRAFQSKVFRAHTKRQYNQLPDVVKRRQLEKEKKLRQHQRIITDIFKKNLQKRVLTGKLNVSNSIALIPI